MTYLIVFAILLAIARLFVSPGKPQPADFYKDIAHLFMGGLFAFAFIQQHAYQWWVFGLLSGWEVFVAVGSRTIWNKKP